MSNSLQPHGLQHTRLPCFSPSPWVCSNSCPLSRWCLATISSSVVPFSSCLQSFSASGSFPMSQLFASGTQPIGASASASILSVNIQDWFPLRLTTLISLLFERLSRVFFNTTVWRHQFFSTQPFLLSSSHIHSWLLEKTVALTIQSLVGKVMSLLFNMLSRFVFDFLPRSKWKVKSLSCVWLFATPWTVAYQAPLSMEFSRQYWSGLPFPSPGDLPNPGIKPRSPELQADTLPFESPGKPRSFNFMAVVTVHSDFGTQ